MSSPVVVFPPPQVSSRPSPHMVRTRVRTSVSRTVSPSRKTSRPPGAVGVRRSARTGRLARSGWRSGGAASLALARSAPLTPSAGGSQLRCLPRHRQLRCRCQHLSAPLPSAREGGGILEADGWGLLLTTRSWPLAARRHPPVDVRHYGRSLGARHSCAHTLLEGLSSTWIGLLLGGLLAGRWHCERRGVITVLTLC